MATSRLSMVKRFLDETGKKAGVKLVLLDKDQINKGAETFRYAQKTKDGNKSSMLVRS